MRLRDSRPERISIFGRDEELAAGREVIDGSQTRGLLLVGAPGTGTSLLGRALFTGTTGRAEWLAADRVQRMQPFAALAPLLDGTAVASSEDVERAVVRALSEPGQPAPVIFVDNGHDLDSDSISVLAQLAAAGEIRLVTMVRPQADIVGALSQPVLDGVMVRIDLDVLSAEACSQLVDSVLGGTVATRVTEFFTLASGRNPSILKALLVAAQESGVIVNRSRTWILSGRELCFSGRPADMVRTWKTSLSCEDRDCLDLVTLAGPLPLDMLIDVGYGGSTDRLLDYRILEVASDPPFEVRLPLHLPRDLMRQSISALKAEDLYRRYFPVTGEYARRSALDHVRWAQHAHVAVDPAETQAAARQALSQRQPNLALKLLSPIVDDDRDLATRVDFAAARLECGDTMPAEDLVELSLECTGELYECLRILMLGLRVALKRGDTCNQARAQMADWRTSARYLLTEPTEVAEFERLTTVITAGLDLCKFTPDHIPDDVRAAVDDPDASQLQRDLTLVYLSRRAVMRGRQEEAHEIEQTISELGQPGSAAHSFAMILEMAHPIRLRVGVLPRYAPAPDVAHMSATSGRMDFEIALEAFRRCDTPRAQTAVRRALACLRWHDDEQLLPLALALAALIASTLGDSSRVQQLIDELELVLPNADPADWTAARAMRFAAEYLDTGSPETKADLAELADHAAERSVVAESWVRGCALLIGDLPTVAAMSPVDAGVDDPSVTAVAQITQALKSDDATTLVAVRNGLMSLSASAGRAVEQRIRDIAERTGDSQPVAQLRRNGPIQPSTDDVLTPREREIGELILLKTPNKTIAKRLGISVRTVEGHCSSLFRKLGISRRSELRRSHLG